MQYDTIIDIGRRKRTRASGINEDSLGTAIFDFGHRDRERTAGVFVVADGAGGHDDGDMASYIATNCITQALSSVVLSALEHAPADAGLDESTAEHAVSGSPPDEDEIHEAIVDAIHGAHRAIFEYANEAKADPLTTVVASVVFDGKLYYGWVGDSRAYVLNRDHEDIALLTRDHSVVEKMRQRGEIDDVEAEVHKQGNEISRAVGGSHYEAAEETLPEVDTGTVPLYESDIVMLTSDGLVDAFVNAPNLHEKYLSASDKEAVAREIREKSVTDDEILDTVLGADSLEAANESLVSLANQRGGKDNMSIILAEDLAEAETPKALPPRDIDEDIESSKTVLEASVSQEGTGGNDAESDASSVSSSSAEQRSRADRSGEDGTGEGTNSFVNQLKDATEKVGERISGQDRDDA
jgi:serine/threonine protein phosphatase PrpC